MNVNSRVWRRLLVLLLTLSACSPNNQPSELTFTAIRGDFKITVNGQGVLEAKHAHNITTPNLRRARPQIGWLAPEGARVKQGEVVVELEAGDIERDYLTAIDELAIAKAEAQKGEAELNLQRVLLESQLKETEASLATSRLQLSKMAFEPPRTQEIRKLEIAKSEIEVEKITKKLAAITKIQKEEIARLQLQINQAENKLQQARHYLSQLQLTAPVDGFIEYAESWLTREKVEVGGQLWPGMPIVQIPDLRVMQVKLQLPETEAQKLRIEEGAIVSIPSLQNLQIPGKVSKVDKIAKPVKRDSKVKRVEVLVELDSTATELAPGLTADCVITLDKIPDVVQLPQECVFQKDSTKIVYVLKESFYLATPVWVEKYGEDFVAVASGLKGGELCALQEPAESLIRWPENLTPLTPVGDDSARTSQPVDSLTNGANPTMKVGVNSMVK